MHYHDATDGHAACQACQLHQSCRFPFLQPQAYGDEWPQKPILVINEAPTLEEDADGYFNPRAKVDSKQLLISSLRKAGVDPEQCVFSGAVKCAIFDYKPPTPAQVKKCRDHLLVEIERIRPVAILMVGNHALLSITKTSGITKKCHRVFQHKLTDGTEIPAVAILSPGFVLRDRNQESRYDQSVKFFARVVSGKSKSVDNIKVEINPTPRMLIDFYKNVREKDLVVGFDVETNTLEPYKDDQWRLLSIGLSDGERTYTIPIDSPGVPTAGRDDAATRTLQAQIVIKILEDDRVRKVAHNAKYDSHILSRRLGVDVRGLVCDTMLLHLTLFPIQGGHDLKTIASELLGLPDYTGDLKQWIGEGKDPTKWVTVPYEVLGKYNGIDCHATVRLYRVMMRKLAKLDEDAAEDGTSYMPPTKMFHKLVMGGFNPLYRVEQRGFYMRAQYVAELERTLDSAIEDAFNRVQSDRLVQRRIAAEKRALLEEFKAAKDKRKSASIVDKIRAVAFNPGSDDAVGDLLFGKSGYDMEPTEKTSTGQPSVAAAILKDFIKHKEPCAAFVRAVLDYRTARKMKSTFVVAMREHCGDDGRVHCSFNIGRARTGRLSSSDPNLQNIPRDGAYRSVFGAPPGWALAENDYSQIELRFLAMYSRDENMCAVYREGRDLHLETAMAITGATSAADVSDDMRTAAKSVNFGIAYGLTKFGLAHQLSDKFDRVVTLDESQAYIDAFYNLFPGVEAWQMETKEFAQRYGYVYTMFGTRRLLANAMIRPRNKEQLRLKEDALRQAINTPIQGTASYCAIIAIMEMERQFQRLPWQARVVSTVHDSILIEAEEQYIMPTARLARRLMVDTPTKWIGKYFGDVPIVVDIKTGNDWGKLVKEKDQIKEAA